MPPADDAAPDTNGASAAADPSKATAQGRQQRLEQASVADHFVVGIYPFFHGVRIGSEPLLSADSNRPRGGMALPPGLVGDHGLWSPWLARLDNEGPLGLLGAFDDSYFFLPHVRSFLFPEFHAYGEGAPAALRFDIAYDEATVRPQLVARRNGLLAWARENPRGFAAQATKARLLHLTLQREVLSDLGTFELHAEDHVGAFSASVSPLWVDLWLFPYGVGQVVLGLRTDSGDGPPPAPPACAPTTLDRMDRLLRILPILQPRFRSDRGHAQVRRSAPALETSLHAVIDFLLQGLEGESTPLGGGPGSQGKPHRKLDDYLQARGGRREANETQVPRAGAEPPGDDRRVYGARLLTYAYLRSKQTEDRPDLGIARWTPGPRYASAWEQLGLETALRVAWLTSEGETLTEERAFELDEAWARAQVDGTNAFRRYSDWAGVAFDESFLAVATRTDHFNRTWNYGLAKNLYHDYLALYVYRVFVRCALLRFAKRMQEGLLRHGPAEPTERGGLDHALDRLRPVHAEFLHFRGSHWLPRVTARHQGEELRALFSRALALEEDYRFIEGTLDDVVEAIEVDGERRRNESLYVLSAVLAPASAALAFFSIAQLDGWKGCLSWAVLVATVVLSVVAAKLYLAWRVRRSNQG